MEFGVTADSRIIPSGQPTAMTWALNKVIDTKGNYYVITYVNDSTNGQNYPSRIDYTGNASITPTSLAPYNSIQFAYDYARGDVMSGYGKSGSYSHTARLRNVKTFVGTTLVNDYQLTYDVSAATARSRITSIIECDGAGVCLPGSNFTYQNDQLALNGSTYAIPAEETARQFFTQWADIDGDGRQDFCRLIAQGTRNSTTGLYPSYLLTCKITTTTGFGGEVSLWATTTNPAAVISLDDIDGDGKADACMDGTCYLSTGTSFGASIPMAGYSGTRRFNWTVDLNGDGRIDTCWLPTGPYILNQSGSGTADVYCSISQGTSFGPAVLVGSVPEIIVAGACDTSGVDVWYCPSSFAHWADITGDGVPSFCVRDVGAAIPGFQQPTPPISGAYHCRKWSPAGFGPDIATGVLDLGYEATQAWVDINGDGKADLCRIDAAKKARCTLSTGIGYGTTITSSQTFAVNLSAASTVPINAMWLDANADGLVDICDSAGCVFSMGDRFSTIKVGSGPTEFRLDINGDGIPDGCTFTNVIGVGISRTCTLASNGFPDLLTSTTNGLGANYQFCNLR
jgi:hypothetical protein